MIDGTMLLLSIFIVAVGAVFFFFPQKVWELGEFFRSTNAESPTKFYRVTTKVAGAVFALVGVAGAVMSFIL